MIFPDVARYFRPLRLPLTPGARSIDRIAWALAVFFVLFLLAPEKRRNFPHDLYQFWVTGQALKSMPISDIYSPRDQQAVMDEFRRRAQSFRSARLRARTTGTERLNFTATPMLAFTLNALSSGDFEVDARRFRVASGCLYGIGFLVLAAALGFSGIWALILVVLFTEFYWPYQMNMIVANVGGLQVGAFLLTLALLRNASPARYALIGFLLGYLNLLKPTLAPAAVLLLISLAARRRWPETLRYVAGLALAALLGLALPWFAFGTACTWSRWREAMPAVCFTEWGLTGGFLGKLIGLRTPALFGVFSAVLILAAGMIIQRSNFRLAVHRRSSWLPHAGMAALGALIVLVSSPIVRSHYFVAAAPAALIALRPGGTFSPASAARTALRLFAVFLLAAHPFLGRAGLTGDPHHSLWTFAGVWILIGMLVWDRFQSLHSVQSRLPAEWHRGAP